MIWGGGGGHIQTCVLNYVILILACIAVLTPGHYRARFINRSSGSRNTFKIITNELSEQPTELGLINA